jgi:hypothetical protein
MHFDRSSNDSEARLAFAVLDARGVAATAVSALLSFARGELPPETGLQLLMRRETPGKGTSPTSLSHAGGGDEENNKSSGLPRGDAGPDEDGASFEEERSTLLLCRMVVVVKERRTADARRCLSLGGQIILNSASITLHNIPKYGSDVTTAR